MLLSLLKIIKDILEKVENEKMSLNELGKVDEKCWNEISNHFKYVEFDYTVVMPNHIHGIIIINVVETWHQPRQDRVMTVVPSYKI